MIEEIEIGDFRFVAQTTFFMYVKGRQMAILITSDKVEYERQKQMALDCKIHARNKPNPS